MRRVTLTPETTRISRHLAAASLGKRLGTAVAHSTVTMFNRVFSVSIALLSLVAGCDAPIDGPEVGDSLRCGEKGEVVEATPELASVFDDFQFELQVKFDGASVELASNLDAPCIDGQTHEVSSKSGHHFEEDGVIYYVTYTVVTQWVCEDGQWVEGLSYCPVDQPCFSVTEADPVSQ